MTEGRSQRWLDAARAASLLAIDPLALRGIVVRGGLSPVGRQWLELVKRLVCPAGPVVRLPVNADMGAVHGNLDIMRMMRSGKRHWTPGLIERVGDGLLVVPMADQLSVEVAMATGRALQSRFLTTESNAAINNMPAPFVAVALDESDTREPIVANGLTNQMAMAIDLTSVSLRDIAEDQPQAQLIVDARKRLTRVVATDQDIRNICDVGDALGVTGMTGIILAVRVACASAALGGYTQLSDTDLQLATRLVLAHRATRVPPVDPANDASNVGTEQSPDEPAQDQELNSRQQPDDPAQTQTDLSVATDSSASTDSQAESSSTVDSTVDMMVHAARAVVPTDLLNDLLSPSTRSRVSQTSGRFGAATVSLRRGKPIGSRAGQLRSGNRLSVSDTVRAAIPYQRLRQRQMIALGKPDRNRLELRPRDCRIKRFRQSATTQSIFVVDASGSAAVQRLAEAKGAVELLLADCYVRRDTVSLIAFRGRGAQLILPPTRSLARAKRELARLHGGGGTPTASALQLAIVLANQARQSGQTPVLILLTDGRSNVTLDGEGSRARANDQALHFARRIAGLDVQSIVIDTALRAATHAQLLADSLRAECINLPFADASAIKNLVRERHTVGQ